MISRVNSLFAKPTLRRPNREVQSESDRETDFIVRDFGKIAALEEADVASPQEKLKLTNYIASPVVRLQVTNIYATGLDLSSEELIDLVQGRPIREVLASASVKGKNVSTFKVNRIKPATMEYVEEKIKGVKTSPEPDFLSSKNRALMDAQTSSTSEGNIQDVLAHDVGKEFQLPCGQPQSSVSAFNLSPVGEESEWSDEDKTSVKWNSPIKPLELSPNKEVKMSSKMKAARGAFLLSYEIFQKKLYGNLAEQEIEDLLSELKEEKAHDLAFQIISLEALADIQIRISGLEAQVQDLSTDVKKMKDTQPEKSGYESLITDMLRRIQGELTELKMVRPAALFKQAEKPAEHYESRDEEPGASIDQDPGLLSKADFDRLPISQRRAYLACHGSKFSGPITKSVIPDTKLHTQMKTAATHKPDKDLRPDLKSFKPLTQQVTVTNSDKLDKFAQLGVDTESLIDAKDKFVSLGYEKVKTLRDWVVDNQTKASWAVVMRHYRSAVEQYPDSRIRSIFNSYSQYETLIGMFDAILTMIS